MSGQESTGLELIDELLAMLDEELRLLRVRIEQFEELGQAILSRDNARLETLLEEMTEVQQAQARLDRDLATLRELLARQWGLGPGELKLLDIARRVDGEAGMKIEHRREQVILLAETLKRKHLNTAVLLSESARVNRQLLEGLLPSGRSTKVNTYGPRGAKGWSGGAGLVDAEM